MPYYFHAKNFSDCSLTSILNEASNGADVVTEKFYFDDSDEEAMKQLECVDDSVLKQNFRFDMEEEESDFQQARS